MTAGVGVGGVMSHRPSVYYFASVQRDTVGVDVVGVVHLPVVVVAVDTTRENRTEGSCTMKMGCATMVVNIPFVTCSL